MRVALQALAGLNQFYLLKGIKVVSNSVVDPNHFVMDPDPAFQFDTDPGSTV